MKQHQSSFFVITGFMKITFSYLIGFVSYVTVLEINRSENYDNTVLNFSRRRYLKLTSLELIKMLKSNKFVHF